MGTLVRVVFIVLVSAICGAIGYKLIDERLEVIDTRLKAEEAIHRWSAITNLDLEKFSYDENMDMATDVWGVSIRKGQAHQAYYYFEDKNFDRIPDHVGFKLGWGNSAILFRDDDFDGRYDATVVILQTVSNPSTRYEYRDLNADGKLDTMSINDTYDEKRIYVLLEDKWTRVRESPDMILEETVMTMGEEDVALLFEDGEWSITTQKTKPQQD